MVTVAKNKNKQQAEEREKSKLPAADLEKQENKAKENEQKNPPEQKFTIAQIQAAKNGIDHPSGVICPLCNFAVRKSYCSRLPKRYYKCQHCRWTFYTVENPKNRNK